MFSFEVKILFTVILFAVSAASLFLFYKYRNSSVVPDITVGEKYTRLKIPPLHRRIYLIITIATLFLAVLVSAKIFTDLRKSPLILFSNPGKQNNTLARSGDIQVTFSTPIVFDSLKINTNPQIDFTLKKHGYLWNLLPFGTSLTISPSTTQEPGAHIMVYFVDMKSPFTKGFGGEQLLEMKVENPEVLKIDPPVPSENVATKQEYTVAFSSPFGNLAEWSVKSEPAHPLSLIPIGKSSLRIKPNEPFKQGTKYRVILTHTPTITTRASKTVVRTLDSVQKANFEVSTVNAVNISSFTPSGNAVDPKEPIVINFKEQIDTSASSQYITINPPTTLKARWDTDGKKLTLEHDELKKDTKYSVTLSKELKTRKGGTMQQAATFDFETAGPLTLQEVNPGDGSKDVATDATIKLIFDQKVPQNVKDKINISPNLEGSYSVQDNIVEFKPKNKLANDTKYTFTIAPGTPSIYGLPSSSEKTVSFITKADQVRLAVPYFRQQTPFTCNVAAARMLLAYRNVTATEQDIINKIGYQAKRGSGNPHKGYVDNFGTFWEAIHTGVTQFRGARIISSGNLNDILAEVKRGNPVMTWGQNGWSNPYDISWTASDGTFIKAYNGMHSVVVVGYVGSSESPTTIWVNDPWRGQYGMKTAEFLRRWSYYKMAMVIE